MNMTHKVTVLIIEDEKKILTFVSKILKKHDYKVLCADTGKEGLSLIGSQCPDIILLDLGLPDLDGCSIIQEVRAWSSIPIIVISARSAEKEKVAALDLGADDYITKPFSVSELIARLEALTRRIHRGTGAAKPAEEPEQLVSGPFVLDEKSRVLYKSGKPIDLTQVEFQIMELFFRNPGTALVREKILEGVWGKGYFGDVKIVDVNIRRLRMKVEDEPSSPQHILTVWGYGYRWNA